MFEKYDINDSFKNSIMTALDCGKLSHALIFEGSDEKTRLAVAKETAKGIVCTGENKPCMSCNACFKAERDSHGDIHILVKEEKSSMIKIDAVRDIKTQALAYPNEGPKSVFIIHEAQFMNVQAQNALLKIFEEPASHVCFILTCDSKASLLDTIISRATAYSLGEGKNESYSEQDALAFEKARELVTSLVTENELGFLRKTAVFLKDKAFFRLTAEKMILISRDALILQSGVRNDTDSPKGPVDLLKNHFTQKKNLMLIEKLNEIIGDIDSSANMNLTVTRFSSSLYSIKIKKG